MAGVSRNFSENTSYSFAEQQQQHNYSYDKIVVQKQNSLPASISPFQLPQLSWQPYSQMN